LLGSRQQALGNFQKAAMSFAGTLDSRKANVHGVSLRIDGLAKRYGGSRTAAVAPCASEWAAEGS